MKISAVVNWVLFHFAPKGQRYVSPGQRPGKASRRKYKKLLSFWNLHQARVRGGIVGSEETSPNPSLRRRGVFFTSSERVGLIFGRRSVASRLDAYPRHGTFGHVAKLQHIRVIPTLNDVLEFPAFSTFLTLPTASAPIAGRWHCVCPTGGHAAKFRLPVG